MTTDPREQEILRLASKLREVTEERDRLLAWQAATEQGEPIFYHDPKIETHWDCSFLPADLIDDEDNRQQFTVPLYTHQPKGAPKTMPEATRQHTPNVSKVGEK